MNGRRYWAFISYSHRDNRWADWLHRAIETYRPPKQLVGTVTVRGEVPKRLTPVFRDRDELASATDLGSLLREALAASTCQIVVCSPQAAKSKWVNEEILAFKRLGREDRIFCLIVGGEPNATDMPGREEEECFPPALRYKLGPDGNLSELRTEPIAADARPGKDGKENAKLKLIAGVLGVGFDALRRREQQRRNRRLVIFSTAAMSGMVVTSGLAAYALVQRNAAERQRARAEAEAEIARQTTNFLVDLFRISDPSEARGNAVTAREMLDKGAKRIDRELAKQPEIRATLLDTVGTVYMGLGLYREARPLIEAAIATRRDGAAADRFTLAQSLSHDGELLLRQAEYDAAEKAYREAIAIQSALPDNPQSQAELAKATQWLGRVQEQQGRYAEAEKTLREALEREHHLYGATHADIAATLKALAFVIANEGKLESAIPMMRSAVAMQRELRGSEPHPELAEALNDLAQLLVERKDYDEAQQLDLESLAMNQRLLGDKHPSIATGLNNLGYVLQQKRDLNGAETLYRQALVIARETLGAVHPLVATLLDNIAMVQHDRGDIRRAIATQREQLVILAQLFPQGHPDVADTLNALGLWLTEVGEYAEADRDLHSALEMRRRFLGEKHEDVAATLTNLALLKVTVHEYDAALASARGALAILSPGAAPQTWRAAVAESAEGAALAALGRRAEGGELLVHAVGVLNKDSDARPVYLHFAQRQLERFRARPGATALAAAPATPPPTRNPP